MHTNSIRPRNVKILISLLTFIAIGGIPCGIILLMDPSGQIIGLPLNLIENTPLSDFTLVGLWLFVVYGIFPLFLAFGMFSGRNWKWAGILSRWSNKHWTWVGVILMGVVLIVWSITETVLWRRIVELTVFYGSIGVALILLSLTPSVKKYLSISKT